MSVTLDPASSTQDVFDAPTIALLAAVAVVGLAVVVGTVVLDRLGHRGGSAS